MSEYEEVIVPGWEVMCEEWKAQKAPRSKAPRKPISPAHNHRQPTVLFNTMINSLIPMGIKGVIWYQGETNARNKADATEYATLFPTMIKDWRGRWGQGEFPFLFVQLAGWGRGVHYPVLRDSQQKTLSVSNTGLAVAYDIGEEKDIHPKNKVDVGKRLGLVTRNLVYGEDVVYSGPVVPFFEYPPEIRKIIYTTNAIESLNSSFRKIGRHRNLFPTLDSLYKLFYLAVKNIAKKWSHPVRGWPAALNRFTIEFGDRINTNNED